MREDLDHARHGVRAVDGALRAVDDFDLVHVIQREIRKIDGAAGIIGGRAVDEDFRVIRIAAVEEERSFAAFGSGAIEADAGKRGEQVGQRVRRRAARFACA